jgi:glyoxylase-like metal-dependent hydrolase (beta-lactamase superfamily II)
MRIVEGGGMKNREYSNIDRRALLKLSAAFGLGWMVPSGARAQTVASVGSKSIRTLSDGNLSLPISFLFPDVAKDELEPFLTGHSMSTKMLEPECNLTLIEDGERLILIDAGAGSNFMASAGKLPGALDDAGIDPGSITDVLFTHGHPDHLWGIVDDFDEIAFPEANLHFPRPEWDFWRADDVVSKMSEGRQTFAIGAQNRLHAMEDRVQLFDGGNEVLPGIEAVDTAGHTPGHMAFAIHGGNNDDPLMVIGDALTNSAVSFEKPDWPSGSDQDPQQGIATRRTLLDRLAGDKMQIIGYHLPNGGLGRVETADSAYRFVQA